MKTAIECANGGYLIINYSAAEHYDVQFPLASGNTVYVTYEKEIPEDAITVPSVEDADGH